MKESLKNKTYAAQDLYRHLYELKDWHVEDESVHSYLRELCQEGLITDYLNLFS